MELHRHRSRFQSDLVIIDHDLGSPWLERNSDPILAASLGFWSKLAPQSILQEARIPSLKIWTSRPKWNIYN